MVGFAHAALCEKNQKKTGDAGALLFIGLLLGVAEEEER